MTNARTYQVCAFVVCGVLKPHASSVGLRSCVRQSFNAASVLQGSRGMPRKPSKKRSSHSEDADSRQSPAVPSSNESGRQQSHGLARYRQKRDFSRTREPSGAHSEKHAPSTGTTLAFVIQKHAASHLHFDLRLELDDVMKSWAVPKGPSLDPSVKRLAMQVEDHPMEYNKFEGTIPKGQYGGGTVMLWDRGSYSPDEIESGESESDAVRRGLRDGKLAFTFRGERLAGSFALVRTRRGEGRAQWLLIKHHDETAYTGRDIVDDVVTSVASGRTMEEIAQSADAKWQSNRNNGTNANDNDAGVDAGLSELLRMFEEDDAVRPMMATEGPKPSKGSWAMERRYEGMRTFILLSPRLIKLVVPAGSAQDISGKINRDKTNSAAIERELARLLKAKDSVWVLDGWETDDGKLVLVDVLIAEGQLMVAEPWLERRRLLDEFTGAAVGINPSVVSLSAWTPETVLFTALHGLGQPKPTMILSVANSIIVDASVVSDALKESAESEIVLKRIDAAYEGGPSDAWRIVSVS